MLRNSKLSGYSVKKIVQCLSIDIPTSKTVLLLGKNRNTINRWYGLFRPVIYRFRLLLKDKRLGSVGVDESYFGAKRHRGYNGLVDVGYPKHFRVSHGDNEFARDEHCHTNGIESFWSFTKRRLAKFNGVSANFELYLKESDSAGKSNLMNLLVGYGSSLDIKDLC